MLLKRIFLGLVVLLVSAPNMAASVADRSPFAQGSWWDPTRSGSGFELISTADQVAAIWFTYDDSGRPVWYTAQGDVSSLGAQSWPLLRHRWSDGGNGDHTVGGSLRLTVSYLPNAQRPQPLGKPYELLYSTRFLGDRLYAVTFKKIDPLYIVDLADSSDPRISGELELPGFSDYLHPLPNGLLLGFGKDARPADVFGDGQFAWYQGLQLTLFDVANAGQPREIQRVVIGKRGSDSALLRDHHAFSALVQPDGSRLIAIPARVHDGVPQYYSGDSTFYPWQESGLMHWVLRGTSASDARLTQLPSLITARASQGSNNYPDSAQNGGRSVLFRNGTVYVGNGQFWRQDSAGNSFGPY